MSRTKGKVRTDETDSRATHLASDETLDLVIGRHMAGFQMGFPIQVAPLVSPFLDGVHLFRSPYVEIDRFDW